MPARMLLLMTGFAGFRGNIGETGVSEGSRESSALEEERPEKH
jgi:hypothetical protein